MKYLLDVWDKDEYYRASSIARSFEQEYPNQKLGQYNCVLFSFNNSSRNSWIKQEVAFAVWKTKTQITVRQLNDKKST